MHLSGNSLTLAVSPSSSAGKPLLFSPSRGSTCTSHGRPNRTSAQVYHHSGHERRLETVPLWPLLRHVCGLPSEGREAFLKLLGDASTTSLRNETLVSEVAWPHCGKARRRKRCGFNPNKKRLLDLSWIFERPPRPAARTGLASDGSSCVTAAGELYLHKQDTLWGFPLREDLYLSGPTEERCRLK